MKKLLIIVSFILLFPVPAQSFFSGGGGGSGSTSQLTAETKIDDYIVTTDDFGKSLRMNNGSSKTFTLPSVGSTNDGGIIYLYKIGAGDMVITAADSDTVGDSTDTSVTCTSRYICYKLEYCHATTKWLLTTIGAWS